MSGGAGPIRITSTPSPAGRPRVAAGSGGTRRIGRDSKYGGRWGPDPLDEPSARPGPDLDLATWIAGPTLATVDHRCAPACSSSSARIAYISDLAVPHTFRRMVATLLDRHSCGGRAAPPDCETDSARVEVLIRGP